MKLVIATGNRNKITEIKNKFYGLSGIEVIPLTEFKKIPEIIEDAETFTGNALKKARIIRDFTGLAAMADDSGLAVDALNGEPGVYSARYGGEGLTDEKRYLLLLEKMKGIIPENRNARFICCIALALPDGREFTAEGTCEGIITDKPSGENGFGYDPVFLCKETGKTFAEMTMDEKSSVSHRGKALSEVRDEFSKVLVWIKQHMPIFEKSGCVHGDNS